MAAAWPSRRRQEGKMASLRIYCHADIQALQDRYEEIMIIKLFCLESVSIASDSYPLLRNLIEQRCRSLKNSPKDKLIEWRLWRCPRMDLLSIVAGVAMELLKVKHGLYPLLVVQEAKLEVGFLKTLLLLKNSGAALLRLAKEAKKIVEARVDSDEEDEDEFDLFLGKGGKVEKVGKVVKNIAAPVLEGTQDIAWLQARLPSVLEDVCLLLSTRVHFPDPNACAY